MQLFGVEKGAGQVSSAGLYPFLRERRCFFLLLKKKGTDRPCHAHQAIRDMGGRGNVPDILNIGWYMPNL